MTLPLSEQLDAANFVRLNVHRSGDGWQASLTTDGSAWRIGIGAELKPSYWRQAVQNCERAAIGAKRIVIDLDAFRREIAILPAVEALRARLRA